MKVSLTRKYEFSSAHRLDSQFLTDSQNIDIYDKCNNLNGHGHDYTLEVTVKGQPDEKTGMIIPLQIMDSIVQSVISVLDYKHLDKEVVYFKEAISTAENIIQYLWQELQKTDLGNKLYHLKLWETNNNYFEFGEENIH
jgi:6-pyruvoyltetrahydropterin/6-carboxytetrahydropterin synthase